MENKHLFTYDDILALNAEMSPVPVNAKKSATEVPQRVRAFRQLFPEGIISTELTHFTDNVAVVKASVFARAWDESVDNWGEVLLATGTGSAGVSDATLNRASWIESAETCAVGRALGFLGIGSDEHISSAEELATAFQNQKPTTSQSRVAASERKVTEAQAAYIGRIYSGEELDSILEKYGAVSVYDLPFSAASGLIESFKKGSKKK